jgi:hypothetical protein
VGAAGGVVPGDRSYADPDAYAVYSAVIPSEWAVTAAHAKNLVIARETTGYKICLKPDNNTAEIIGPAIENYEAQNRESWMLEPKIETHIPFKLLNSSEVKEAFENSGWEGFYRNYPDSGGIIELSAVGFNSDKTIAVVYVGHSCGMLCGGGSFHVLEKKNGNWTPLKWNGLSCSWVS